MRILLQDIGYGFRMLARNPGFSAVVILILAVCIGANTVMLSVVDGVMFRACPYKDSDSLVFLHETNNPMRNQRNFTSRATFLDWREQNTVFEQLIGVDQWTCTVRSTGRTERNKTMVVSPEFFSVLGARPVIGRDFAPEDYRAGSERVVILSHSHWQRYFGADTDAIGKTITLDEKVHTVIGVLPEDFRWVFQTITCGLWTPMPLDSTEMLSRGNRGLDAIGRLKSDVSLAQAQAEMDLIANRLGREYPEMKDTGIFVVPISESYARAVSDCGKPGTLLILMGIVGAVLLIACLHVGSLLLIRSVAREQEIAVRAALGARRLRLVRQLFSESAVLACLGGLFGFVLAYWAISILSTVRGESIPWYLGNHLGRLIPWYVDIHMDWRSLFYILAISFVTCGLFGLLPAVGATRMDVRRSLSACRTPSRGPRFHIVRSVLVISDIAIAFVLLIAAGLMINSYVRVVSVETNYNPKNVLTMGILLDELKPSYSEAHQRLTFFQWIMERAGNMTGAQCAAASSASPIKGSYSQNTFVIKGSQADEERMDIPRTKIMGDYLEVLEIPLLRGRCFSEDEIATSAHAVIINEAMAKRFWPEENPIGRYIMRVARRGAEPVPYEIVGVVGNVEHSRYAANEPEVYLPGCDGTMYLMLRTGIDPRNLAVGLRKEVLAVDKNVFAGGVSMMEDDIADVRSPRRFNTLLLGAFGVLALVLASLGVYGTTAYVVSHRTHEIGIRVALGAQSGNIFRLMVVQGLKLAFIGTIVGLVGALALTRVISSLLFEVSPTDPLTFLCVSLLLISTALLASYIPAQRAAKIDPMAALRYE
ncbi:MAG: ABC transporter permease [Sedimentisphaerales bacterium]|nr:ABC transporter permease [Sedimentisphaerales bacterium]